MKHILIAEDESAVSRSLSLLLKKNGYRVKMASNGVQALYFIKTSLKDTSSDKYDLLITDLYMPGLNGMQLIDEIKQLHIEIPTMVITGYGDKDEAVNALRKGCMEFITKPIDEKSIIDGINRIFEKLGSPGHLAQEPNDTSEVNPEKLIGHCDNISESLESLSSTLFTDEQRDVYERISSEVEELKITLQKWQPES